MLKPIWRTKSETASRLRGRIERVLDAAKAKGLRSGDNPARWRGHLATSCRGARSSRAGTMLRCPMRGSCVPERLRGLARSFTRLPRVSAFSPRRARARRSGRDGTRSTARRWSGRPAERMKGGREHRVPLTERMLGILDAMTRSGPANYVFPAETEQAFVVDGHRMVLRRMKVEDATVHGFRSAFRDRAAEETRSRARLPRRRLPTSSATLPSAPIAAAMRLRSGGSSWKREAFCQQKAANN